MASPHESVSSDATETIVPLNRELSASTVEELQTALAKALEGPVLSLTLDFEQVEYIDSVGLSLLITVHGLMNKRGGRLRGVNLSPELFRLFTSMRLDRHFDLTLKGEPT